MLYQNTDLVLEARTKLGINPMVPEHPTILLKGLKGNKDMALRPSHAFSVHINDNL